MVWIDSDRLSLAACHGPARTGATPAGCRGLTLLRLARLLIEAALLEILEQAGADKLAAELLECPVQTVVFAEGDFDHERITNPLLRAMCPKYRPLISPLGGPSV